VSFSLFPSEKKGAVAKKHRQNKKKAPISFGCWRRSGGLRKRTLSSRKKRTYEAKTSFPHLQRGKGKSKAVNFEEKEGGAGVMRHSCLAKFGLKSRLSTEGESIMKGVRLT